MKVGNAKIERFREQHGFAGWLATSAKTGENCSDQENAGQPSKLKQLIARSIAWDKLPWTATPRLLDELKKGVVAMRDETIVGTAAPRCANYLEALAKGDPSDRAHRDRIPALLRDCFQLERSSPANVRP